MEKEGIPQENETIAARRAERLAERIKNARGAIGVKRAWWSDGPLELLSVLFILSLNFYLIYPFFGTPAPPTTFSGPVIPLLARLIAISGIGPTYAIQLVDILFFLLFPYSFYLFVRKISGRKLAALLATIFVSLPISPLGETRVQLFFLGSEGAHMASLSVVPLAIYSLLTFLHDGGAKNLILASLSATTVALISPFGFFTYIIFAFITAFSELLLGKGRLKLVRMVMAFAFAGGLSSFWYNPAFFFWMISGPMGQEIREMISRLIPISFFVFPVLGAFGYLLFDRKPDLQPVFLASFYSIAFAFIVWAGGGLFPSHPSRYLPEFGISLSLLFGMGILKLSEYLKTTLAVKFPNLPAGFPSIFLTFLLGGMVLWVIVGRGSIITEDIDVLGLWTDVEKGEIWVAKDKFNGAFSLLGYITSSVTLAVLGFLGVKAKGVVR